jgi:hypothetical protein
MTGKTIIAQAWGGVNDDCDRLEEFEGIVLDTIYDYQLPPEANPYVMCRYMGHIEGMLQAIDELYHECGVMCCDEGNFIAEISALAYCELSFLFGGLATADAFERLPVQYCGAVFQICCDSTFNTFTYTYVDDSHDDPATEDVNEGACKLYTDQGQVNEETGEPMWGEVWEQVQEIQCGYLLDENESEDQ